MDDFNYIENSGPKPLHSNFQNWNPKIIPKIGEIPKKKNKKKKKISSKKEKGEVEGKNQRRQNWDRPLNPPQNKPLQKEILNCRPYLIQEIEMMGNLKFVLALGNLAHRQLISSMGLRQTGFKFGHETIHTLPDKDWKLVNSYHPSRYNINTKRLTYQMFLEIIQKLMHWFLFKALNAYRWQRQDYQF